MWDAACGGGGGGGAGAGPEQPGPGRERDTMLRQGSLVSKETPVLLIRQAAAIRRVMGMCTIRAARMCTIRAGGQPGFDDTTEEYKGRPAGAGPGLLGPGWGGRDTILKDLGLAWVGAGIGSGARRRWSPLIGQAAAVKRVMGMCTILA